MAVKPLWALAGHVIVNGRDQYDLEDPHTLSSIELGTQVVWSRLIESGSFALKDLMDEIEKEKENPIDRFWHLEWKLQLFPPTGLPVDPVSYEYAMQDDALKKIWDERRVFYDRDLRDHDEIKQWLVDPQQNKYCDVKTSLHFERIRLRTLPLQLSRFSRVQTLDVSGNWLASIPECLKHLSLLKDLNLTDNRIRVIPLFLGDMTQLTFLGLSRNQIRAVPGDLEKLVKLEMFYIQDNQITSFPNSLAKLTQLKSFDADKNRLTCVPQFLSKLISLKSLSLNQNLLAELPEFLRNLTQLKKLFLSKNLIQRISSCLRHLTKLCILDLSFNRIEKFPEFVDDLRLKSLYLEGNKIRSIPDALEKGLQKMEFFVLYSDDRKKTDGFGIYENPLLCIFDDKMISPKTALELVAMAKVFNHYKPTSLLARFSQSVASCDAIDQEFFFALKVEDRTLIAEMRGMDLLEDFFGDVALFAHAVRKAIAVKYERLPVKTDNVLALIDAMDALSSLPLEQSLGEQAPKS